MSILSWYTAFWITVRLVLASAIEQIDVHITMTEEVLAPGSLIKNLSEEPAIKRQLSSADMTRIHFHYLSTPPAGISVEPSGEIRITEWVDRENICPNEELCEIEVDLAIQPVQYFTLVRVIINVEDINDNKPEFAEARVTHVVSEITRIGTSFVLPEITDPDSPRYSVRKVTLRPATEQFELKTTHKADGSLEIRLVLKASLDRESVSHYHLQATAVDGGDPEESGVLEITIIVADANDNHPVFDQDTYEATIVENAPVGFVVITVHASDLDKGANGHIVYRFSSETSANLQSMFSINNDTGEITVKGKVDHERGAIWCLTVEARDRGEDPIPTETLVIIHIDDVNDNAPEIMIHTLGDSGDNEAVVLENTARGTFVARIVVTDRDSGENGRYNCSLYDDNFVLDPFGSDFLITTRGILDREKRSKFSLIIKCHDYGRQALTTTAFLRVNVEDINDNSPNFSKEKYFSQITENNYPKTVVIQMTATDPDYAENGSVQYMIQGRESQWFTIDPISGVVKTRVSLDREIQATHQIIVVARDKGMPSLSASTTLTVNVLDTNDESPQFTQNVYKFRVYENEPAGTEVGLVEAEDKDSEQYNQHTYHLEVDPFSAFHIDADSGRITIIEGLDREEEKLHVMLAVAVDTHEPHFSSSTTVSVYVMDRNDNQPRFIFPSPYNNTVYIGNDLLPGSTITKVEATDKDDDHNGRVRYQLVDGSDELMYFQVSPHTGVITLLRSLHHIDNGSLMLTLMATDDGDIVLSSSAKLYIIVDKSLSKELLTDSNNVISNVIIIVIVACVLSVVVIGLVLSTCIICKRNHGNRKRRYKYDKKTLAIINAKDDREYSCELSLEKKGYSTDNAIDKDVIGLCKLPDRNDSNSNCRIAPEIDLSTERSGKWLKQAKTEKNSSKMQPDAVSVISGLSSNPESSQEISVQGDLGSRSTIEYGFTPGYHKDVMPAFGAPEVGSQKYMKTSTHGRQYYDIGDISFLHSLGSRSRLTSGGLSLPRNRHQPANIAGKVEMSRSQKIQKHCEPIMFARCHGNLPTTAVNEANPNSVPLTNAHGYHGNAMVAIHERRGNGHETLEGDTKRNALPVNDECASSLSGCHNVGTATQHSVTRSRVTDIVV